MQNPLISFEGGLQRKSKFMFNFFFHFENPITSKTKVIFNQVQNQFSNIQKKKQISLQFSHIFFYQRIN